MNSDSELSALQVISNALDDLDDAARSRVLRWAFDRFGSSSSLVSNSKSLPPAIGASLTSSETLADFFATLAPETENDKVLVVGYWFQVRQSADSLDAAMLNRELTHLGHALSNVTRTFDRLMAKRPALAIQLQKMGKTQQARKKYKITTEGIRAVERMARGEEGR